jgi:RNA polymerase sigma factor (TIGR02999 family)
MLSQVYDELRDVARRQLELRAGGGTLSPTGLVHEAYLKLAGQAGITWKDRGHFMSLAALAMRHVLVDRARARFRQKRGGAADVITFDEALIPAKNQASVLLRLSDAIDELAALEPRLARVIDCRFFGGFSDEEIAAALGVTTRTVQRDGAKARMLLRRALSE